MLKEGYSTGEQLGCLVLSYCSLGVMITSEAFVRILCLIQRSDLGELTLFRP